MEPLEPEHADPELDALLRSRRPRPDPAWVEATEHRLLPGKRRLGWRPAPALRLGAAIAVALAALVLVLSLAGSGPLSGGDQSVKAKDDCRNVTVTRTERVPAVVEDAAGEPQVVYRSERRQRVERVCR